MLEGHTPSLSTVSSTFNYVLYDGVVASYVETVVRFMWRIFRFFHAADSKKVCSITFSLKAITHTLSARPHLINELFRVRIGTSISVLNF